MMTEPLWWRLSAGRRFAQGLADLPFEKRTRFLFVGETMIRHASPSRTVTATSGGVHGATTWSCLIAPPSVRYERRADGAPGFGACAPAPPSRSASPASRPQQLPPNAPAGHAD